MIWAFWQDYYKYSEIDKDNITQEIYDGSLDNSIIDTPLIFDILLLESNWSTLDGTTTIRDVHSIYDMDINMM